MNLTNPNPDPTVTSGPILHQGGYGQLVVLGDIASGTLTVQAEFDLPLPDGVANEWVPQDSTLGTPIEITTVPASAPFLASRCNLRVSVAGSTNALDINWFIRPLPLYTLDRG